MRRCLICIILMLCGLLSFGQQADCPQNIQFTFNTPDRIVTSQTIDIPISVKHATDVQAFLMTISYNPSVLSFVGVVETDQLRMGHHNPYPGAVSLAFVSNVFMTNVPDDEIIGILQFEVIGDVRKGANMSISNVFQQEVVLGEVVVGDVQEPCIYNEIDYTVTNSMRVGCDQFSVSYDFCHIDDSDFSDVKVRACGGVLPITYEIESQFFFTAYESNSIFILFENVPYGDFLLRVTDANGAVIEQMISYQRDFGFDATLDIATPICNEDPASITIDFTSRAYPITVLLDNHYALINEGSFIIDDLYKDEYSLKVTDAYGSNIERDVVINRPSTLEAEISIINASCSSGKGLVHIGASGGVPYGGSSYLYNNDEVPKTTDSLILGLGEYIESIQDANGCRLQVPFEVLEGECVDNDGDGYGFEVDCDDNNAGVNPGATEIENSGFDENCDGVSVIIDLDGDGWNSSIDCDDTNPEINGNAEDIPGNGIDENCDGEDETIDQCEESNTSVDFIFTPICNNSSILEVTNTSAQRYEWSSISTTPYDTIFGSGLFIVTITDALGCEIIDSFEVTSDLLPQPMEFAVLPLDIVNANCEAAFLLAVSGGLSPYEYSVDDTSSNDTLFLESGVVYNLLAKDSLGCGYRILFEVPPIKGSSCDDSNPNTENDMITEDCECVGEIVSGLLTLDGYDIQIYPNPASDRIYVETDQVLSLELYDIKGRKVMEVFGEKSMDISQLPAQLYLLKITDVHSHQFIMDQIVISR